MAAGLYGKLPAKRDFVASNAPRRFLETWEPWLQASVATSRQTMGEGWLAAYNSAPIWRFWLGAAICGEAMIGAFMASIDGVGRSFPLTLFCGEGAESLAPPELEPNHAWCESAEDILLEALSHESDYETIAARVAALAQPLTQPHTESVSGFEQLSDGSVLVRDFGADLPMALRAVRRAAYRRFGPSISHGVIPSATHAAMRSATARRSGALGGRGRAVRKWGLGEGTAGSLHGELQ